MNPQVINLHYRRENCSLCNLCNAHLNQRDFLTHMTEKHCDSYFYKCNLCRNYYGNSRSSLFQHQRDKHDVSYNYLSCPLCMQFSSQEEKEVITHLMNVHSRIENLNVCNYCSFISKSDLEAHYRESHLHYVCVFYNCRVVCQSATHLFQHYMGHHFPQLTLYHGCSECDIMFPRKDSLYQHKSDKHGIYEDDSEEYDEESEYSDDETFIEFRCPMCPFTAWNKKDYEKHFINKHPANFFNCKFENCNYQTKLFWSITQHTIDKHFSENILRYNCYVCEEISYGQIHSLIQHLRDKHSVVDECSLCNTYEEDLPDHIQSIPEHSYDVFSCKLCDEEYEEKADLVQHISDKHVAITPLLRKLC